MYRNRKASKNRKAEELFARDDTIGQIEPGASCDARAAENGRPQPIEAWTGCGNSIRHSDLVEFPDHAFSEGALCSQDCDGERRAGRCREIA